MLGLETVLGLLVAVSGLGIVARRLGVPHPIVLVIGGLLIGLVPIVPRVELPPDLIFLLILPPLLYVAAFYTSVRDFRAQARPILELAIGLVLATTVGIAVIAHWAVPELGWAAAFALGAIVSPPDAVAATAIFRQVRVPRAVVTVLEGESLLNDATGLVAYRFAVAAVVTGSFSLVASGTSFLYVGVVGIAVGLAAGWLVGRVRRVLRDPPVEITISLLTPFAAYLPAEAIHASGVLAAVACGLYLSIQSPRLMDAATRIQARAVWDTLIFVLDGLVFVLIGLQLPGIVADLSDRPPLALLGVTVLVCASVILIRFAWVFLSDLPRLVRRDSPDAWREDVVVSWVGMRGVVSLAAALALPFETADGSPFPQRDLIIFLTVCVIVVTLVGQGLSLPLVMRLVKLPPDGIEAHEEASAREAAVAAAVRRIDELSTEWPGHLPLIDTLRAQYAHRASHLGDHVDENGRHRPRPSDAEQELIEHRAIRHSVIEAQREAILELRDNGAINDDVWREVERELDLEEFQMEA